MVCVKNITFKKSEGPWQWLLALVTCDRWQVTHITWHLVSFPRQFFTHIWSTIYNLIFFKVLCNVWSAMFDAWCVVCNIGSGGTMKLPQPLGFQKIWHTFWDWMQKLWPDHDSFYDLKLWEFYALFMKLLHTYYKTSMIFFFIQS